MRSEVLNGCTLKSTTPCGSLYITINENSRGKINEVFAILGKNGVCGRAYLEALGRTISLALRNNVEETKIIKTLKGIRCNESTKEYHSCPHALAMSLNKYIESKQVKEEEEIKKEEKNKEKK